MTPRKAKAMTTTETPRYQAFIIAGFTEIAAEPRYSQREARADADQMHQEREGKYKAVVLDLNHYSVGSLASCVYMLAANEE